VANGVRIVGEPRIVGERKNHLQFRVAQGGVVVKVIAWSFAERAGSSLPTPSARSRSTRPSTSGKGDAKSSSK
jgi:hypothetical protein